MRVCVVGVDTLSRPLEVEAARIASEVGGAPRWDADLHTSLRADAAANAVADAFATQCGGEWVCHGEVCARALQLWLARRGGRPVHRVVVLPEPPGLTSAERKRAERLRVVMRAIVRELVHRGVEVL